MAYKVKHLHGGATFDRPRVLLNNQQQQRQWHQTTDPAIEAFHQQLPHYGETKLHALPSVAKELGVAHVFVKDESTRFGLPSFKILGASWAIYKTLCKRLDLPTSTTLTQLRQALEGTDVTLVTCTEGNWGRATARMGKYLGVRVVVYVPYFMNAYTRGLIEGEGAEVRLLEDGSYDDCLAACRRDSRLEGVVMVLDTSWEGFTEVPQVSLQAWVGVLFRLMPCADEKVQWVTDGYSTMLHETDRQVAAATDGKTANITFASVGVGSWAHAVVAHYKAANTDNKIVTVEPDIAACFKESLHCGELTPIETGHGIMNGMICGTPSLIAWPILRDGSFAAVSVTEKQSHECVQYLESQKVNSGPCGAANLAALRTLCREGVLHDEERKDSVVVLFSTEGMREYEVPN